MANPLAELTKVFGAKKTSLLTGTVDSVNGDKVVVILATGNKMNVWGSAQVGSEVLIKDKTIIAKINRESVKKIYVP